MASIRNPIEWGVDLLKDMGEHATSVAQTMESDSDKIAGLPTIKKLKLGDIRDALAAGLDDFMTFRTDVLALSIVYPFVGAVLWWAAANHDYLPLLFPLASGFALLGPVAAIGLYEMSRQRETGSSVSWNDAFQVLRSPALGAMIALGLVLLGIFLMWLVAAELLYGAFLGPNAPVSLSSFLTDVLTTGAGWEMTLIGLGVGFVFAVVVLSISVFSFPMLVDRTIGLPGAVVTSLRAVAANPVPMALWGAIVAGSLAVATVPLFLGLVIVVPVLGHATWHLYRKAIAH